MAEVSDVIVARTRRADGKGGARKMRRAGFVPAVAYGPGAKEPVNLALEPRSFNLQRQVHGLAHIYEVEIDGKKAFKALVKHVQRDVVRRDLEHVDLYAVDMNKPVKVSVRIDLEGKPAGLAFGGVLTQLLRRAEVLALPANVPQRIVLDVTAMNLGDTLHLSDLPLPEGVKLTSVHDEAVASVSEVQEEKAPVAAAEGEEGAEAAAAEGEAKAEGAEASGEAKEE